MTIHSAILALNPTVYWPMDDGTGPAASDASGHGFAGIYQPNTVLQVPGPEAGTFGVAAPVPLGGVQLVTANPVVLCTSSSLCSAQTPVSMSMWLASNFSGTTAGRFLHIGTPASNGVGLIETGGVWQELFGGSIVTGSSVAVAKEVWHLVTLTYDGARFPGDPSGGVSKIYVDLAAAITVSGHIPSSTTAADPLVAATPEAASIAHAAFWTRALSVAEHQSIYTNAVGLQSGTLTGRNATDFDVASLTDRLTALNASCATVLTDVAAILAAVRKTW